MVEKRKDDEKEREDERKSKRHPPLPPHRKAKLN